MLKVSPQTKLPSTSTVEVFSKLISLERQQHRVWLGHSSASSPHVCAPYARAKQTQISLWWEMRCCIQGLVTVSVESRGVQRGHCCLPEVTSASCMRL